jgi:hypothetical protein
MYFRSSSSLMLLACLSSVSQGAILDERGTSPTNPTTLSRRGEPDTGGDLPDTEPHPNNLDQVETAFKDAIELTAYEKTFIDTDNDIFPHYFDPADRAEVTRIFTSINNNDQGSDMLSDIMVQSTDSNNLCTGQTIAYMKNGEKSATDKPYIVLCPTAFKKKAVTTLNGKTPQDSDVHNWYAACKQDGGDIDDYVSCVSKPEKSDFNASLTNNYSI